MHPGRDRSFLHSLHVEIGIEESDIVRDRPGQQAVILGNDAHMLAPRSPQFGIRPMTVKIDGPRGRSLQTQEQLQESCLTAARRPGYRNKAAGLYVEIDVLQDELVGGTIAK